MAKVTVNVKTKKEKKTVEVEVKTRTFTLELSEEEVQTLMIVWSKIGGSPTNSCRKYYDSIVHALRDKGINYPANHASYFNYNEGLFFRDNIKPPLSE